MRIPLIAEQDKLSAILVLYDRQVLFCSLFSLLSPNLHNPETEKTI